MVLESKQFYPDQAHIWCQERQSHHLLPQIFDLLWSLHCSPRGSFVDSVFRVVLFHQSLYGLEWSAPAKALTPKELGLFMDPRLFDLMLVMMTADSGSYTFLYRKDRYEKNFLVFKAMVKVQRDIWYEANKSTDEGNQSLFLKNGDLIYQEVTEEMLLKQQMTYQNFQ